MNTVEILILDFGSQYTQLIARRIREGGIYSEVIPFHTSIDLIKAKNPKGLILSGGPASIYEEDAFKPDNKIFDLDIPILGICYGMQYIVDFFGGKVRRAQKQEYGKAKITIINKLNNIFAGIEDNSVVWMSHADKVVEIPENFSILASSENTKFCAIVNKEKRIFALQFHPEVIHTTKGSEILKNFASRICKSEKTWNMKNFAGFKINLLKEKLPEGKVLCAVSGGIDSSVVATLLHKAIENKLISVFVDTGLLRADEVENVQKMFENIHIPLITIDAKNIFLNKLKDVRDPEEKRKIIGETFIEVFQEEAKRHGDIKYLAQGTLYPDIIESVSIQGPSKVIKSHHNVGGLPSWMKFELVEPLRELFKDEVRNLGLELGLPQDMLLRHPFPGPGLAIRIMGCVDQEALALLKKADKIFIDLLKEHKLYNSVWQAFCVLLNVKSVGVMGDNRTYANTICIRAVNGQDGMSAEFSRLDFNFLEKVSNAIVNEVSGVNRVVYDITGKPPGTIEWE